MDRHLTRQGALNVTSDIDRIATLVAGVRQPDGSYVGGQYEALGIPEKIAYDFAWRCDVLSDAIEKRAVANDEVNGVRLAEDDEGSEEASEDEGAEKTAAPEWAKPAQNETGDSVEPTGETPNWDANAIADDVGGPHKQEGDEPYMGGEFSQQEFHELRDKQQAGQVPGVDRMASLGKLAKMVAGSSHMEIRTLSDRLKGCIARLEASKAQGVGGLISGAKKQVVAMDKLSDDLIKLDSTGEGSPELLLAADKVATAVSEILPHLEMVEASSADQTSPSALLEHEQLLEDGTIAKLVSLAGKITDDAMKSIKGGEKADKEASAKSSEEDEGEDSEEEGSDKTAGYDLFAA
jgi:hypothetical protein